MSYHKVCCWLQWLTHCLKMMSLSSSTTPQLLLWLALEHHTYSRTYQTSARNTVWLWTTVKIQDPMQPMGVLTPKAPQMSPVLPDQCMQMEWHPSPRHSIPGPPYTHTYTYIRTQQDASLRITEAAPNQSGVHYLGVVCLSSRERL